MSLQSIVLNISSGIANRLRLYPRFQNSWTPIASFELEANADNILEIYPVLRDDQGLTQWPSVQGTLKLFYFFGDSVEEVFTGNFTSTGEKYTFTINVDLGDYSGTSLYGVLTLADGQEYFFYVTVRAPVVSIESSIIRMRFNTESIESVGLDQNVEGTPSAWRAAPLRVDLACFRNNVLLDLDPYDRIGLAIKVDTAEGIREPSIMYSEVEKIDFREISEEDWKLRRNSQASIEFTASQTSVDIASDSRDITYWMVLAGIIDSPESIVTLGFSRIKFIESGFSTTFSPPSTSSVRILPTGQFQLYNDDQSLWQTLRVRGSAGVEYLEILTESIS
jgi:hypothetical protein